MGRKSQSVGAELERWLVAQNEELLGRRLADVKRTKPELNIIGSAGKGGRMVAVPSGVPCADFEGVLAGGRSVVFDAKSVDARPSFAFGSIRDKQLEYMARRARFGARAFFYVRRREDDRTWTDYIAPVSETARIAGTAHRRSTELLALTTRESVRFDALDELGCRVRPGEMWFEALARLMRSSAWARLLETTIGVEVA